MLSGRSVGESSGGSLDDLNRQEFFSPEAKLPAENLSVEFSDWQSTRLPRQVVSLAFLSESAAGRYLSESLAQSLCVETNSPVILVRFTQVDQPNPQNYLNGEFHLPAILDRTEAGFHLLAVGVKSDDPP